MEDKKKNQEIIGGIVVCLEHHDELHKGECSTGQLAKLKCEKNE